MQVPFTAWSPDIRHHTKRQYKPRPRLPEEHAEPAEGPGGAQPAGTGVGRAPSEAGNVRSEGSQRSRRSGGSEASTARGHMARKVVVPQPSRDELGEAHTDPPLDRVTLAARQPDPAWTQQVPPGPDGRQRHLSAVWDMELESRGVQGTLRISFPCPIVLRGGSNLPAGQELVGMFAYRLVSGHWRVQTGVSRIGEEGTVTTAGICGLNVLTGWEQRRPGWVDVAWLAMRVHVGRQGKGVVADVIDVEEDEPPPRASGKGAPKGTRPPPSPKAPRTATPGERAGRAEQAEPVGGRGQRGVVQEWVDQQRAGAWEARAISAEAANRDLEARLSRVHEDRRDCESRLADVTRERDRLATKVKTLERDVATLRKAKPAAQPAEAVERAEGARAPAPPGDRWGGAVLPVSGTSWPGHRPGMPRPRHAPARCPQCPPACGWP